MTKHLESLYVKNFRCLDELTIEKLGDVNLLVGGNNSGKTTVLEALYLWNNRNNPEDLYAIIEHLLEKHHGVYEAYRLHSEKKLKYVQMFLTHHGNTSEKLSGEERNGIIIGKTLKENIELKNILEELAVSQKEKYFYNYKIVNKDFEASLLEYKDTDIDICSSGLDAIVENGHLSYLIKALQLIDSSVVDVRTSMSRYGKSDIKNIIIFQQDKKKPISLKSMGEGMERILGIGIAASLSQDGILLIDEIENGLHYSIQEKVWNWLFTLAKEYNMQIFATTHSKDIIESFNKVAQAREEEGVLISLGRSKSGKLISHPYSEESLDIYVTNGMEVR